MLLNIQIFVTMSCHGYLFTDIFLGVIWLLLYNKLLFTNKVVFVVLFVVI